MISKPLARNAMHTLLCTGLVAMAGCNRSPAPAQNPASSASAAAAASAAPAPSQTTAATPYTPLSADQLYQLVAPIALFPDNLVAQVLAGSTYPDQITAADNLLTQNPGLKGDALQAQVNPQPWDASVKALTTFPSVLDQMARNPQWTSALGEAYVNDPTDVMNAIQVMRQRASRKGNLRSNAQQVVQTQPVTAVENTSYADEGQAPAYYDGPSVVEAPPQTIEIMPAQQDTVYVPSYDPQTVYGGDVPVYPSYSYQPGGYSTGEIITAGAITFGAGILIGTLLDHHHDHNYDQPPPPGGGWHSWGMNWGGRGEGGGRQRPAVIHDNTTYVSNSTTVVNRYTTNNIHTTNNINNSRTTINNVDNSRNQVVQNRNVGNRTVSNPTRPAANPAPAAATRGAMSMPHFGKLPQQQAVRTQPARALAHAPNNHVPSNLERANATTPHAVMPHTPPARASVSEPNRVARPMPASPPQREAVRPMPPPHVTAAARPAVAPHVEQPRPAMAPRPAPRPAAAPRAEPRSAAAPHVAAAPHPAPAQHPKAVAAPHPQHPAAPEKKDKHDNNEHS